MQPLNEMQNTMTEAMANDTEYEHLIQKQMENETGDHLKMIIDGQRHEQIAHVQRARLPILMQKQHDQIEEGLNATMVEVLLNQMGVAEICSPPRVAAMAKRMGMRRGWSLDFTTCDKDGRP